MRIEIKLPFGWHLYAQIRTKNQPNQSGLWLGRIVNYNGTSELWKGLAFVHWRLTRTWMETYD